MRLKTRFFIAIMAVLIGFITISGLVAYLVVGVNRLNTAGKICNDTMNTLKQLQINTSDLLTTHELDKTFSKWQSTYQGFQREIDTLNNSPAMPLMNTIGKLTARHHSASCFIHQNNFPLAHHIMLIAFINMPCRQGTSYITFPFVSHGQ